MEVKPTAFWCGFRVVLLLGLTVSVTAYTVGAILSGVAFHSWNYNVNCTVTYEDKEENVKIRLHEVFPVDVPMDVVGPSLMSFGAGIFFIIFIEWFFVKPFPTFMVA